MPKKNDKPYVFYNGEYYWISGASVSEERIADEIGEIQRITFRSFLNKNWDSNFGEPGAKICMDDDSQLCIEISYQPNEEIPPDKTYILLIKE